MVDIGVKINNHTYINNNAFSEALVILQNTEGKVKNISFFLHQISANYKMKACLQKIKLMTKKNFEHYPENQASSNS